MLRFHQATRGDALVDELARLLAAPLRDPFMAEVVAVPTRGVERWIAQRLSARLGAQPGRSDGISANIEFPSPAGLLAEAVAAASGIETGTDPWRPDRLVWALLEAVDAALDEPWLQPLARHFAAHPERRLTRARSLARLFDEYGATRPTLIRAWAAGDDGRWQAELWRRARATIGVPSAAERLPAACALIREQPELLNLPPRLTVFGLTRLPAAHLEVLSALAAGRDVHLMLNSVRGSTGASGPANRLLASWGRESRTLLTQLRASGAGPLTSAVVEAGGPSADAGGPSPDAGSPSPDAGSPSPDAGRETLLHMLQDDIDRDLAPPGAPLPDDPDRRAILDAGDFSVRIHSCHGRARQVEVLREAILHRLAADPTLEARDVIIMCPDVEAFAPLVEGAFGGSDDPLDRTRALRVRIADRSLRQTNPVLGVVSRLLDLAVGRVSASEVLDLADSGPVRQRFALEDDDLSQLREWISDAGIHWGLDAQHRARFKLAGVETGTWAAGLQRLLLGVALDGGDRRLFGGALPTDGPSSSAIALAGALAELVDRLGSTLRSFEGTHTVQAWTDALMNAAKALTATSDADAWQLQELERILDEMAASAPATGAFAELALPDLRALLGHRLEGRPTRANFRTGHLTVCALTPMRSVPHRVVCLLGLDDGTFPRRSRHDGDNLLLEDRQPGDRDPRAEDRQLLLDALLAAQDALIITYTGHDERTNAPRPPAVPVGELLDAIDATAQGGSETVIVRHPLQPFDPRNFGAGHGPAPAGGRSWSFDQNALAGALAFAGPRQAPPPFLDAPLPPPGGDGVVTLDELVAFVSYPVRAFLRQRLGISLPASQDEVDDSLPIELDALQRWGVGQRLLDSLLAGVDPDDAALSEYVRGSAPPGLLGEAVVNPILRSAGSLAARARAYAGAWEPKSLETNLTFADGTRLTGSVSGVHGNVLLSTGYARLNARARIAAWVRLLALTAAHPELAAEAVTIGRPPHGGDDDRAEGEPSAGVRVVRIPQLGADPVTRAAVARAELERLLTLRAEGLCEPLYLPCLSAEAYAAASLLSSEDPVAAATRVWTSTFGVSREDLEPEHQLVWDGVLDYRAMAARAAPLWRPLISREVVE